MKIIFLGIQGSGKSTQAKIAAEKLSLPYIETSQLLREKSNGEDEDAKQIANAFEKGNLVVDEITIRALKERLKTKDCQKGYILDGYPRNEIQFQNLDSDIGRVFYVKVSDEEAIRRLSKGDRNNETGRPNLRRSSKERTCRSQGWCKLCFSGPSSRKRNRKPRRIFVF